MNGNAELARARAEVGWWFGVAGPVSGLGAVSWSGGGGGGCWDARRQAAAHDALVCDGHRVALEKYERVRAVLWALPEERFRDLMLVYGDVGRAVSNTWVRRVFGLDGGGCAFGLALTLDETRSAWLAAGPKAERLGLRGWVEREVGSKSEAPSSLRPIVALAKQREGIAIAMYAAGQRAERQRAEAKRRTLLERELEILHSKLWGGGHAKSG